MKQKSKTDKYPPLVVDGIFVTGIHYSETVQKVFDNDPNYIYWAYLNTNADIPKNLFLPLLRKRDEIDLAKIKASTERNRRPPISTKENANIHKWLRETFGNADHCNSLECTGESNLYQWALLKGCDYEYKRENFIPLCAKCHGRYDAGYEVKLNFED